MKKDAKWLVGLSVIAFPAAFIVLLLQIVLIIAPYEWWVEYHSVEPLSDKILTGSKPRFESKLTVRRSCSVEYNDVLFCKNDGKEKFVYTYEYSSKSYGKTPGKEENEWIYQRHIHDVSECYLRSTIILHLPFGIEKTQIVTSSPFSIVDKM